MTARAFVGSPQQRTTAPAQALNLKLLGEHLKVFVSRRG
jgi:hypothetical protein